MLTRSETVSYLRSHGYVDRAEVLQPADVAVLGDTLVVWPTTSQVPYRLHFFGEALERIERQTDSGWEAVAEAPDLLPNHLETPNGKVHPGEYVVHPVHGIGLFQGIERRQGTEEPDILLSYAGGDLLRIPESRVPLLMPYLGSRQPKLTRLHSVAWRNTLARVHKDLIGVARTLLKGFLKRQRASRPAWQPVPDWESAVADGAGFTLTQDQVSVLELINAELMQPEPMDRLLVGDVGFGKTEVALRAAVRVLAGGGQVLVVAPTTLLAEQHARVFEERLEGLPVRIGRYSRLAKRGGVLQGLADGSLDLVIGTHRLLSPELTCKRLGLLIIDEEQRFGVKQKERLRQIRPTCDTLALSATPIPRTLALSLGGIRGLSQLQQPPQGRLAVRTEVEHYHDGLVRRALLAELERGGQVFVVHPRVGMLGPVMARVQKLLQETEYADTMVGMLHGQLPAETLQKGMESFMRGETRVLVATNLVGHGLDCPEANTLIVLRSERFGLADLHQLRGRVGRRSTQAHALFCIGSVEHADYNLDDPDLPPIATAAARARLQALEEHQALGSGWQLAVRDLELRGSGNLLGVEQHGNLESVGLLLYTQLLSEELGKQAQQAGIPLYLTAAGETRV